MRKEMVDSGGGNVLYWYCLAEMFVVRLYYPLYDSVRYGISTGNSGYEIKL